MGDGDVVDLFAPDAGGNKRSNGMVRGTHGEAHGDAVWQPRSHYSADEFYIRSDKKGQSQSMTVRLAPDVSRRVSIEVQSGRWPYQTTSDFMRDAILHRLQHLTTMVADPELEHFVRVQMNLARTEMRQAEVEANSKLVTDMKALAAQCIQANDYEALGAVMQDASDTIDAMRHPYAGQLKRAVREWYGAWPASHLAQRPNIYAD